MTLLENTRRMTEKFDIEMADSVLGVCIEANRQVIQKLIGDEHMFEALMEIMEPKMAEVKKSWVEEGLSEGLKKGLKEGLKEGLREGRVWGTVETLRDMQYPDSEIKLTIIRQYGLTEAEADAYLHGT